MYFTLCLHKSCKGDSKQTNELIGPIDWLGHMLKQDDDRQDVMS